MDRCDVIVVGGGPAGSACARALTDAGIEVHLFDKCAFPRDKPCAGWITPEVVALTGLEPAAYAVGRVFQPVTGFRIRRMSGPAFQVTYGEPVSYGICRCEFDQYLLERCGATLHLGEAVQELQRAGDFWRVNERIEAPVVVGAGGHFCPVARHLNRDGGEMRNGDGGARRRVVMAQELEVTLTADEAAACAVDPEIPELYFCDDVLGYGWCFRKGGVLNVGLGREDSTRLAEQVARFVERMVEGGRFPGGIAAGGEAGGRARMRGHAYTLYGHQPRCIVDDGLLLVGDAAGLAAAPSGEGIRPAIESGQFAAAAIVDAAGTYGRDRLAGYEARVRRRFGAIRRSGLGLPSGVMQFAARAVFGVPWFVRRVVLERWFLQGRPGGAVTVRVG